MKWCLRVVFDGDRPATADLFQVEDSHIFGNTGCELHTQVGAGAIEQLMKGALTGLSIASSEQRFSWRCLECSDSGGGSGDAVDASEQDAVRHTRTTGHNTKREYSQ